MDKSKLLLSLRILTSFSLLLLLFWLARENLVKISKLLGAADASVFISAFLAFMLSIVFISWRLKAILSSQEVTFSFKYLFPLTLIGYFFTNFMPTTVGGDLAKGFFIAKKMKSKTAAYASILVDRLSGLFSLGLFAGIALILMRKDIEQQFIFWTVIVLFLICAIIVSFLFNKDLLKKISRGLGLVRLLQIFKFDLLAKNAYHTVAAYTRQKKIILWVLTLSVIAQFISFCSVYLLALSLSALIPLEKIFLIMPIIAVLCMLPITMNGLGLREWAFVLFFSSDIGAVPALSLSLLYLSLFLLASIIGGIIYLFWR